jgi:hypothetical protein
MKLISKLVHAEAYDRLYTLCFLIEDATSRERGQINMITETRAFIRKHAKRLIKFAIVGFFGVIVNGIVYTMLVNIDFLNFPIYFKHITLAWGAGILAAFVFNYFVNTFWTYKDAMRSLDETQSNPKS